MNNSVNLTLRDFQPCNEWREDITGEKFVDGSPKYLIDQSTGRKYLNGSGGMTRYKFFLLATLGTPIGHSLSTVCHVVYRVFKLITASHFWVPKENESENSFRTRLEDAGADLLKVVMAPIVLIGLELSAIYGILNPRDGRKMFASLERFEFDNKYILAPCFQPDPSRHLLGGDLNHRNTF